MLSHVVQIVSVTEIRHDATFRVDDRSVHIYFYWSFNWAVHDALSALLISFLMSSSIPAQNSRKNFFVCPPGILHSGQSLGQNFKGIDTEYFDEDGIDNQP